MKHHLKLSICLHFGFFAISQAQANPSCPPEPMPLEQQKVYVDKSPAKNAGFLWRIEKDGRSSWLYGTMHQMHIDYAKPGAQIMFGMRSSDVLAPEINFYEPQAPVSTTHGTFALSDQHLERLKKMYVGDCLAGNPSKQFLGPVIEAQNKRQFLYGGYGPDARLMQIAKRSNKPIVQLETMAIHAKALSPQNQSDFDAQLESSLTAIESGAYQTDLASMAKAWQTNDLDFFIKTEAQMSSREPAFMKRLNDERNLGMAQRTDTLHTEGKKVFVAVGVLHMTGKHGLPKIMQEKGYKVHFIPLRN
jgi:uncharacterized protein